jgi:nucleoside-diphosphate-sugar epimerase
MARSITFRSGAVGTPIGRGLWQPVDRSTGETGGQRNGRPEERRAAQSVDMARILIAGCGYVGTALGAMLVAESDTVWGLRRRPGGLPAGIRRFEADLSVPKSLRDLPSAIDYVVYAVSPGGRDDAHYRAAYVEGPRRLLEALDLQGQRAHRLFFVSSTSVYAQSDGSWVDEDSPTEPENFSGVRVLEGENIVRAGPCPVTVLRLGGIYGPRRTHLIDRVRAGRAVYSDSPSRYTNRIHRDDCAGALYHLMRLSDPEDLYIGVDSDPADEATVLRWLAGSLGAPTPRRLSKDEVRSLRSSSNKRCRNDRLLASGYVFRYPTFREGYAAVLSERS